MPLQNLILLAAVLILLSGFLESIAYVGFPEFPAKCLTVAATYSLGIYGLLCIRESVKARRPSIRWGMLAAGFLAVMLAYYCLEFMFRFE